MSKCKQMIKMGWFSGYLAVFLFFVLVNPCSGDSGYETVKIFEDGVTNVSYKVDKGTTTVRTQGKFRVPAFVGNVLDNTEFLAIICGANFQTDSSGSFTDGVARTSYGNYKEWTAAENITYDDEKDKKHRLRGDFTAVMKEKEIYVLATTVDSSKIASDGVKSKDWSNAVMFIGTVKNSAASGKDTTSIKWEKVTFFENAFREVLKNAQATYFVGGESNGIVTKSGAIVLPIRMDQPNNQMTSSIMYSTNRGGTWQFGGKTENDTYSGSLVEWGDKKLLYIVSSGDGYCKVFESEDMGSTWNKSIVFSGVWGNEPNRTGYGGQGSAIKVQVDGKDILLFSHPLSEKGDHYPDTLQLWLSDGQRIVLVGTISDDKKEEYTGNSILAHFGSHLYVTHEINPHKNQHSIPTNRNEWDGVIGLTSLSQFFDNAKTTVRAWRQLDAKYETKGFPTDGLVGLLENSKDNTVWNDEYKCVNAIVIGGKSVDGGIHFDGAAGSGAQWPVGSQGQNQVYAFANKQFTLAATVTIHTASKKETGQFPLLGASWDSQENNMLLGIGYTNDNKWYTVNCENPQITTEKVFEREKEYHVTLTLENDAAAMYVDGVEIAKTKLTLQQTDSISHFYMGGNAESSTEKGNPCTVKNVMLFNRVLGKEEISKLSHVTKDKTLEQQTSPALQTGVQDNRQSVSVSKRKEATVPLEEKDINRKLNEKLMNKSEHDIRDISLKKDTNGDVSAVLSFSVGCWTCLVCLFLALTGF